SLLFVDSGCDLSSDNIKKLGIECINLPYSINDNVLSFSDEFDYDKFYSKCRKGVIINNRPLTKQEYIDIFEPAIKGDDIIYIHTSVNILDLSVLESVKTTLTKKYPTRRFELIDSSNMSVGQGIFSFLIAKMYRNGSTIDELLQKANTLKNEIAMYMIVDSFDELSNHNLIDSNKITGTALNIKPILAIDLDGKMQIVDKVSGRKKALNELIKIIRQMGENVGDYPIAISHSRADKDAEYIESKLKEYFGDDLELFIEKISPSNTAILGINAICVAFHIHTKIH
ncbi:MAG: DegV family protein, partial [Christensenellales bacterium]